MPFLQYHTASNLTIYCQKVFQNTDQLLQLQTTCDFSGLQGLGYMLNILQQFQQEIPVFLQTPTSSMLM